MSISIYRFDLGFSYWVFIWYFLYIFEIVDASPKLALTVGLIENAVLLFAMVCLSPISYTPLKISIRTADETSIKLPVTDLEQAPRRGAVSNLHWYKTQKKHKIQKNKKNTLFYSSFSSNSSITFSIP